MTFSRSTIDDADTEDSEADPEADVLAVAPEGDNGGVDHPWMKNVRRGKCLDHDDGHE